MDETSSAQYNFSVSNLCINIFYVQKWFGLNYIL